MLRNFTEGVLTYPALVVDGVMPYILPKLISYVLNTLNITSSLLATTEKHLRGAKYFAVDMLVHHRGTKLTQPLCLFPLSQYKPKLPSDFQGLSYWPSSSLRVALMNIIEKKRLKFKSH